MFRKQDSWAREQVKLNKSSDPLWRHVGFIIAQMDGLQAGLADWAKIKGKQVFIFLCVYWPSVCSRGSFGRPVFPHGCFSVVYLLFFPQPLSLFDIQFLNAVGDLLDLIPALASSSGHLLRYKRPGMGHCSALIKVRGQNTFQPRHKTRQCTLTINGFAQPTFQDRSCVLPVFHLH